jgi:hypothetical protein
MSKVYLLIKSDCDGRGGADTTVENVFRDEVDAQNKILDHMRWKAFESTEDYYLEEYEIE